jgi:hypothetical protein
VGEGGWGEGGDGEAAFPTQPAAPPRTHRAFPHPTPRTAAGFFDPKGITGGVTFGGSPVTGNWSMLPLPMWFNATVAALPFGPRGTTTAGANFFRGSLTISGAPTDTYMTLCGWNKGTMWVNGNHVGRYWETQGPQHAFYVPAPLLQSGANDIVIFEQHATNAAATINFVAAPDFTGAVCKAAGEAAPTPAAPKDDVPARAASRPVFPAPTPSAPAPAAAAATAPAACAAPAAGMVLSLQDCGNSAATQWTFTPVGPASAVAGAVSLRAAPSLCVVVAGTNPTTGSPNLELGACDATLKDRTQHFMYYDTLASAPVMALAAIPGAGMCWDCAGGGSGVGTLMEVYGCTGGANQAWDWDASNGQFKGRGSGLCLAAC